jgi:hypothetical protein
MKFNGMNGAASRDMGESKRVPPKCGTVATYVAEGTSLRTTKGVCMCFCTKNHNNPAASLLLNYQCQEAGPGDSAGEFIYRNSGRLSTNEQPVDSRWLKRNERMTRSELNPEGE